MKQLNRLMIISEGRKFLFYVKNEKCLVSEDKVDWGVKGCHGSTRVGQDDLEDLLHWCSTLMEFLQDQLMVLLNQ